MHCGESGQQLLEETISVVVVLHALRSVMKKCWEFEALVKFLGKLKQFLVTIWSAIGSRLWGQV